MAGLSVRVATIAISVMFVVTGCSKKARDMAKYKARAAALAAKYAPKLGELTKRLPDLAAHAKDLPVNVPGASKLAGLIADNKSALDQATDVLTKLPGQLDTDTPEQAEKALDDAEKTLQKDVETAEKDEKEEAEIEAAAAAAGSGAGSAAPAMGSGSGSGAGSAAPAMGSAAGSAAPKKKGK